MNTSDITGSIVLYNNKFDEVKTVVESFLNCSLIKKLYVIDNSETDSFSGQLNAYNVEYIFNGKNLGYGAAHNIAIKKAIGVSKYHLILNPDIQFTPQTLNGLFKFMEYNTDVGLVMPKVLYNNGNLQYVCKRLPTPADLFARRFVPGLAKPFFKSFLDSYEFKNKDYDTMMHVPHITGCFMFIRTKLFPIAGLFDEQFFLYLEDTDLCRRINEYSLTVYYPHEQISHGFVRGSNKNLRLFLIHLNSSVKYFNKWGWFNDRMRVLVNNSLADNSFNRNVNDWALPAKESSQELRSNRRNSETMTSDSYAE